MSDLSLAPNTDAGTIIKNLNANILPRYIAKLEEAKNLLKNYLYELDEVSKRLSKVDSLATRLSLGEKGLDEKKSALKDTMSKLEAHEQGTIDRLQNG